MNPGTKILQRIIISVRTQLPLTSYDRALRKRKRLVSSAETKADIQRIATETGFTYFLDYDKQTDTKQREFAAAIDNFGVDLSGKDVLDIGPGTSDSLDLAVKRKARSTSFVESEPLFARFAEIKGHKGVSFDYRFEPYFPQSMLGKFDVIYTKGSITSAWVDSKESIRKENSLLGFFDFDEWISGLKSLLKPEGGSIILSPAMGRQQERLFDNHYDLDTYYWCPDLVEYKKSFFATCLVENGFTMHENIAGFTHSKAFPIAYYFKR